MLDTNTKRRIDTARDILVGKIPDPKSQVEQITIALIYKFMDDMDAESEEMGGKRKFFAKEFARYGWAKLMRSGLGGHETLNLYAEAIAKMPENPGIPPLFRDIFKNAYLPYRDPETLKAFLKIIDEFTYDHSERLGDAFEYLLSVLGSQGDAGQFRTPRHIIDFIVGIVDPKKNETILDPACGTAGFLISAYKHILRSNSSKPSPRPSPSGRGRSEAEGEGVANPSPAGRGGRGEGVAAGDLLTPDEKGRMAANFKGYDISPDMVRLSLVNMYLHGFIDPHIAEYDTLTSLDRWNEYADVILANPPFMSPKGGIKPHKKFSVESKRSEVLFVDYMAEHLTPGGRAGIIVPEGIIFQSQNAYVALRKMLVENYLVAVVSLPAGVFNPYSGVKTSILILDKSLAKQSSTIAFFKIENDGFGLGAQRRAFDKNDLPQVQAELAAYLLALRSRQPTDELQPTRGLIAPKEKIAANGDYNLSGERYREGSASSHSFPLVPLGDTSLFRVESGGTPKSDVEEYWGGGVLWATLVDLPASDFITQITATKRTISEKGLRESSAKMIPANSVVVSTRATIGRIAINRVPIATNQGFKNVVIEDLARAVPEYVALALTKLVPTMEAWATGGTFAEISKSKFCELQIPLPPLEVQKDIVAEIEGYQKVIDGARAVVDNYRPHVPIHPDWPTVELGAICEAVLTGPFGSSLHQSDYVANGIPVINPQNIVEGVIVKDVAKTVSLGTRERLKDFTVREDDIVIARRGEMGRCAVVPAEMNGWLCGTGCFVIRLKAECDVRFAFLQIASPQVKARLEEQAVGVTMKNLNQDILSGLKLPLPPLATQQAIVAEIEAEQALVAANRELIARFERKIQTTLVRVWGEEDPAPGDAPDALLGMRQMGLWLDGRFWGNWIREFFVSEVKWTRRSVFDYFLSSFPDASTEADKARGAAWERAMSQSSDGSDDPSAYANWAEEKGLETYLGITRMRQAAANLSAVMLWHLLEQQMLCFHMRQVLKVHEEQEVRREPKTRGQLFKLAEFHERLDAGGCSMKALPSWSKVDELRLVANAVKHGPGKSLDDLSKIRPDLLTLPEPQMPNVQFGRSLAWVERPAGGEDIYVSDADLAAYFDAVTNLWQEFSRAIEEHSARKE